MIDILFASVGLVLASPILAPVILLVWLQDFHSPFYVAPRIGRKGKIFNIIKIRSMIVNADKSGVDSTAKNDRRITAVGRFIRSYKIDELGQLLNVFMGNMSLVGPRPNVKRDVALYTDEEKKLLSVKPGITDMASIVFSDEGAILEGKSDPDLAYNQLIRPWKSRLGLLYVVHGSLMLDLQLIFLTAVALFSKRKALGEIQKILTKRNADSQLIKVALRTDILSPYPPPGSQEIVFIRQV